MTNAFSAHLDVFFRGGDCEIVSWALPKSLFHNPRLMDNDTYDQIEIAKSKLEWELNFLVANSEIDIVFYENEILGISLPPVVALTIADCELSVRGDTINKALKLATLETGYELKVPMFINAGEKVLVRTDTGDYDGRA